MNGTVDVDVRLEGALPPGARPDLSVDGTIELEKLDRRGVRGPARVRPAGRQDHAVQDGPGRQRAQRVPVKLGRSSVNTIEMVDGLKVGDQVILSDMSAQDAYNRIRLELSLRSIGDAMTWQ